MSKIYKLLIWYGAVFILALWVWSYGGSVSFNSITGLSFGPEPLLAFILLVSVMALGSALFQNKLWAIGSSALAGVAYIVFFGITGLNLLGVAVLIGLGFYGATNSIQEITQRTKINSRRIIHAGSRALIVGLFVLISFAAYQSPLAKDLAESKRLPSASQTFIRSIVETTVGNQFQASEKDKQTLISQVTRETMDQINGFLKPYFQYSPPILAFGLFLILWGLSSIFVWLSTWLGMLLFLILRKVGFVKIEEKDVKAEVLII